MENVMPDRMPAELHVCTGEACGVSRRAFLGGTMMAVAALLAACGDGQIGAGNPLATDPGGGAVLPLADYPALAQVGGMVRVNTSSGAVAVVHVSQNVYAAFSLRCPHQGTTVNLASGGFVCPNHNARFNAAGQWTGGQRTSNLASIPVAYDAAAATLTLGAGAGGTSSGGGDDDDDDD
jgi:Rieske Fe-S protein